MIMIANERLSLGSGKTFISADGTVKHTQLLTTVWRAEKHTPSPSPVRYLINRTSELLDLAAGCASIVNRL